MNFSRSPFLQLSLLQNVTCIFIVRSFCIWFQFLTILPSPSSVRYIYPTTILFFEQDVPRIKMSCWNTAALFYLSVHIPVLCFQVNFMFCWWWVTQTHSCASFIFLSLCPIHCRQISRNNSYPMTSFLTSLGNRQMPLQSVRDLDCPREIVPCNFQSW